MEKCRQGQKRRKLESITALIDQSQITLLDKNKNQRSVFVEHYVRAAVGQMYDSFTSQIEPKKRDIAFKFFSLNPKDKKYEIHLEQLKSDLEDLYGCS